MVSEIAPTGVDHLFYACANLEQGMDEIEDLLGVRPVAGGRHPLYGTHNALLSLGAGTYLEVIARDPELPEPATGFLVDLGPDEPSRLMTWIYRVPDIDNAKRRAESAGLGEVQAGSRTNSDGSEVRWQLTDPYALPMGGVIPFLINWGQTVHPSLVFPEGGEFRRLVVRHFDVEEVRQKLAVIGAGVEVELGERAEVMAEIETAMGVVTIS